MMIYLPQLPKCIWRNGRRNSALPNIIMVDSFNEMELPKTENPATEMLADYGEKTFKAIKTGNPNAIWVIQGWMFAYQRHIWNPETVKALFSKIPDDRILILDYANDYNNNWQPMNSFQWQTMGVWFCAQHGRQNCLYRRSIAYMPLVLPELSNSPDKKNLVGWLFRCKAWKTIQCVLRIAGRCSLVG